MSTLLARLLYPLAYLREHVPTRVKRVCLGPRGRDLASVAAAEASCVGRPADAVWNPLWMKPLSDTVTHEKAVIGTQPAST